ncbi:hypothetical protein HK096_001201, partial [Nowakowskiella sp. JEL0078]
MTSSVRISRVRFSPCPPESENSKVSVKSFLATQGENLKVWDIEKSTLIASEIVKLLRLVGKDVINAAAWSPHEPGGIIAVGGADCNLEIVDIRTFKNRKNGP